MVLRIVLAGTTIGEAKGTQGRVEMIRVLRATRRSAPKARAQAANQLKGLLITAPEDLRDELRGLSTAKLVRRTAGFRPGVLPEDVALPPSSRCAASPDATASSPRRSASSTDS